MLFISWLNRKKNVKYLQMKSAMKLPRTSTSTLAKDQLKLLFFIAKAGSGRECSEQDENLVNRNWRRSRMPRPMWHLDRSWKTTSQQNILWKTLQFALKNGFENVLSIAFFCWLVHLNNWWLHLESSSLRYLNFKLSRQRLPWQSCGGSKAWKYWKLKSTSLSIELVRKLPLWMMDERFVGVGLLRWGGGRDLHEAEAPERSNIYCKQFMSISSEFSWAVWVVWAMALIL